MYYREKLKQTAKKLVAKRKGILAADESMGTIEKRLKKINLASTEINRRNWRELLFTTPGMEKYISGVILFDETLRQKSSKGVRLATVLKKKGIIPGIKVDKKAHDLPFFKSEKITEGLDGLRDRLAEYRKLSAEFTKWRSVIVMGKNLPTDGAIEANALGLARYAALSQEAGLVPVVEPEVLMKGRHSISEHEEVSLKTLKIVFEKLEQYRIYLPGMLLKTNMVAGGLDRKKESSEKEVAEASLRVFKKAVPKEVPGVVFLSGGLSPEKATIYLDAINRKGKQAWELSYSYGRALQGEALEAWAGKKSQIDQAQEVFMKRARKVSLGRQGRLQA